MMFAFVHDRKDQMAAGRGSLVLALAGERGDQEAVIPGCAMSLRSSLNAKILK
jgi:hypothetical protein